MAESTGKAGTGILPVAGERLAAPAAYGDDRAVPARAGRRHRHDVALTALARGRAPRDRGPVRQLPSQIGREIAALRGGHGDRGPRARDRPVRSAERAGGQGRAPWRCSRRSTQTGQLPEVEFDDLDAALSTRRAGTLVRVPAGVHRADGRSRGVARLGAGRPSRRARMRRDRRVRPPLPALDGPVPQGRTAARRVRAGRERSRRPAHPRAQLRLSHPARCAGRRRRAGPAWARDAGRADPPRRAVRRGRRRCAAKERTRWRSRSWGSAAWAAA